MGQVSKPGNNQVEVHVDENLQEDNENLESVKSYEVTVQSKVKLQCRTRS